MFIVIASTFKINEWQRETKTKYGWKNDLLDDETFFYRLLLYLEGAKWIKL